MATELIEPRKCNLLAWCSRCNKVLVHLRDITDTEKLVFRSRPVCTECGNESQSNELASPMRK